MFKRNGNVIEIGEKVRIEPGPPLVTAKATDEVLRDDQTATHYFAGQRDTGLKDNDGEPVMEAGIDALGKPIQSGKDFTYADWYGFQRGETVAFNVYQLQDRTAAEKKEQGTDAPLWRKVSVHDTEDAAINAALKL